MIPILRNVKIAGTGAHMPSTVYTNEYLSTLVDTSDEWVYHKLGIKERRIAAPDEATSDLAAKAAIKALENAGLSPDAIDLVIVATTTPDRPAPSTASFVQEKIGALNAGAVDISAVCTGFLYAMTIGVQFVATGAIQNVLVIGADTFSKITDWTRRDCVFFGDGAGAVILSRHEAGDGLVTCKLGADGRGKFIWTVPAGGSETPATEETVAQRQHYWQMDGKGIYNTAVRVLPIVIREVLGAAHLSLDDIKYLVPHQPSIGILKSTAEQLGFPWEKVRTNMDKYGNTSAATVPVLLDETRRAGLIENGDNLIFAAVGSGMAWGAMVFKWVD